MLGKRQEEGRGGGPVRTFETMCPGQREVSPRSKSVLSRHSQEATGP